MKKAQVEITGMTPLLMHADNIDWGDLMDEWKKSPENKGRSKAGDDRTPPWRWIGCLNYDNPKDGVVTIPSEYIMRSIMGGAAEVPTGKGKKTFKAQSQSGLLCSELHWPLVVNDSTISMKDINDLRLINDSFKEQMEAVEGMGFSLFVKRAKIGQSKHIRVRPRFDNWKISGEITILDRDITEDILLTILTISGQYKGLGDWRPGSPTPGAFGMFKARINGKSIKGS
jgi:hypothetical protein